MAETIDHLDSFGALQKEKCVSEFVSVTGYQPGASFTCEIRPEPRCQYHQPITKTDQKEDVKEKPEEPRDKAGRFDARNIGDRFAAADRRHCSFIDVFEIGTGPFIDISKDVLSGVRPHLHRRRADPGNGLSAPLHKRSHVADHEDVLCGSEAKVIFDLHPTCLVCFDAELFAERRSGNTGRPQNYLAVDAFLADLNATRLDMGDKTVQVYLDAKVLKLSLGAFGKFARKAAEHAVGPFEKHHSRFRRINCFKVILKSLAGDIRNRTGEFYARWAAAYDDEIERVVFAG